MSSAGALSLSLSRLILILFVEAAEPFKFEPDAEGAGEAKERSRVFRFLEEEVDGVACLAESE